MTSWYTAICDVHREICTIFVATHTKIETAYPEDAREAAMQFLSDHWTCVLKLVRDGGEDGTYPSDYVDKTPP